MFDYSLAHWSGFIATCILLTIAPGPDLAFILAKTAKGGKRAGFQAMYGIWSGAFAHVIMAAFGLSAILSSSAAAFTMVKYLGAAYLVWLGISTFMPSKDDAKTARTDVKDKPSSTENVFRQGVVVALLNPKTALFFLAFLPQFTSPTAGPIAAQLFLHGSLVIVTAMIIEPMIMLGSDQVFKRVKTSQSTNQVLDRLLGIFCIGLGLKLALASR